MRAQREREGEGGGGGGPAQSVGRGVGGIIWLRCAARLDSRTAAPLLCTDPLQQQAETLAPHQDRPVSAPPHGDARRCLGAAPARLLRGLGRRAGGCDGEDQRGLGSLRAGCPCTWAG
jgi:hypothetical protein